jgi:hypothetical protein
MRDVVQPARDAISRSRRTLWRRAEQNVGMNASSREVDSTGLSLPGGRDREGHRSDEKNEANIPPDA